MLRKLIYLSLIIALAHAAACDANCDVTTAGAAGTACVNDGTNDVCYKCKATYSLKGDATCVLTSACGTGGAGDGALFQWTDTATASLGSVPKCSTTGQCGAANLYANTAATPSASTPNQCLTLAACNALNKMADSTPAATAWVCSTALAANAACPNTGYSKDSGKACVTQAQCNKIAGAGETQYFSVDTYTTTVTAPAVAVVYPKQCLTESGCKAITNPNSFFTYKATSLVNGHTCLACPATCNQVAGSCRDTTSGTSSQCWICNANAVAPATVATTILVDDGSSACITSEACSGTNGKTTSASQYYVDSSNGLQTRCKACPSTCNGYTTVSGTITGTCSYGDATTGTCLNCDSDAPYYKDGRLPTDPKTCETSVGSCPKTLSGVSDPQIYSVVDTADSKRCTVITSSSVSSAAISSTVFNSTPNVVVSPGTNSTDNTNWNVPATYVKFGAGLTNGSVYAYGLKLATSGGVSTIAGVLTRTINATTVSNGSDATEASVISGGSPVSVSWPSLSVTWAGDTSGYRILTEAVAGYYIIAYSGYESQWQNNLYAYAWGTAGASTSGKVQITSVANPSTGGVNYQYQPTNIWLEDNVVYIAFTQRKYTYSNSYAAVIIGANGGQQTVSSADVGAYVAGFSPTTGTPFYNDTAGKSSPKTVYASDANIVDLKLTCGPSNYTNSTSINCLYNAGSGTDSYKYSTYYVSLTRSTGSAGSASAVAASTGFGTTYPMTRVQFYPAGIVTGAYASGGLFYAQNVTIAAAAAASLSCQWTYSHGLYWWNTTSGSGVWSNPGISASGATSAAGSVKASGGTLGNGYYFTAAVDTTSYSYTTATTCTGQTTSASTTYQFASFYANGTTNGSTVTLGSLENGSGQYFIDKNGTLWFGYTTQEKSRASTASPAVAQGNLYSGSVGKFQGQLFINTFGNVLSTFFAFLSLILFGLFAF